MQNFGPGRAYFFLDFENPYLFPPGFRPEYLPLQMSKYSLAKKCKFHFIFIIGAIDFGGWF